MRFELTINCGGDAFSGNPPGDLLSETARILREVADLIEMQEFYVPREIGNSPRDLYDAFGDKAGTAGFTSEPRS